MVSRRLLFVSAVIASVLTGAALTQSRSAEACGGCFAPPNRVQTVTDHRMVLAVSSAQTTLWDQFSYTGSPETFSWILPVRNGPNVQLALADDLFLSALDTFTAPQVVLPRPPQACSVGRGFAAGAPMFAASDAGSANNGVNVFREDVVGPYAIAVIGGNDAMAIVTWLTDNGFSVPASVRPVIDYYVGIRSDFLALKLRAGASVNRMNPVRVTVPGYAPTLPLRMVSAGVSDKVGLSLVVIGSTTYRAANFANVELADTDLVWDWQAPSRLGFAEDFRAAQRRLVQPYNGAAWVTESGIRSNRFALERLAANTAFAPGRNGLPRTPVCPPPEMMQGMECVEPSATEDMRVALTGLNADGVVLSRLRSELPASALDRDLQLEAGSATLRDPVYRYGTILNPLPVPQCENPGPARPPQTALQCSAGFAPTNALPAAGAVVLSALSMWLTARRTRRNTKP
jgi:hypothetical protein